MTRMSLPKRIGLYLLAFLVLALPVRIMLEQRFIYFPTAEHEYTPGFARLAYEEVVFDAADGTRLTGWLIPGDEDAPIVLFMMGNAGNMSHRVENLAQIHDLGLSVFIFDYRGYGKSDGLANEPGTYDDIRGAITLLKERGWNPDRMIFFGRSLGAAVALQGALENEPAGVIMESPFTSIRAMARAHYPLLDLLLGWLVGADYDNLGKVDGLQSPLLIFHGERDSICPPEMARQLYEQAREPKQLFWIPGADHNSTVDHGGERYWMRWRTFVEETTGYARRQDKEKPLINEEAGPGR